MKVNAEPAQDGLVPDVSAIATDGVAVEVTIIVIAFEVAVGVLAQIEFEVIIHVTTSLLVVTVL